MLVQPKYMGYIDGLRGIAVLSVLLFHLNPKLLGGGFVGVDVFFVISGFLITQIILKEIDSHQFSFAWFYAHRIRRIFPGLFVMLVGISIGAILFLGPSPFAEYFKAARAAVLQTSNFFFAKDTDYFNLNSAPSPLLHTWTLGVESQFYIFWPIIVAVVYRFFGRFALVMVTLAIIMTSFGWGLYQTQINPKHAFFLLPSRAWELGLGALISYIPIQKNISQNILRGITLVGIIFLSGGIYLCTEKNFPGVQAIFPCLGAALLILSGQRGDLITRTILEFKPLVFLGLISFSLYLWHWPLIAIYKYYGDMNLSVSVQLTIGGLSVAIAYLSYRYIEKPCRQTKRSSWAIILCGVLAVLSFTIASNVLKHGAKASWRLTENLDRFLLSGNEFYETCAREGGAYNVNSCIIGPHKESYEVILSGDSHAAHFIPLVLDWAKSQGLTTRIFLRRNCRSWVLTDHEIYSQGKPDPYCTQLTKDFHKVIAENKSIKIVILALYLAQGKDDIKRSIEAIQKYHPYIFYIGSAPVFEHNPVECYIKNHLLVSRLFPKEDANCLMFDREFSEGRHHESTDTLVPLLTSLNVPYFDPTTYMSEPIDKYGNFFYIDDNHLNAYGATSLVPAFTDFMKPHLQRIEK